MTHHTRGGLGRRALALVGAAALALIGTVAVSTAASADGPSVANIVEGTGSLTVHKRGGDPISQTAPNGVLLPDDTFGPANPPLDGVTFTIQRVMYSGVDIDLMTEAGWNQAQGVTAGTVETAPYSLNPVATSEVTAAGMALFDDLEYGLYYVTEGIDTGNNNIISKAAPFLVSVPYPQASDSTWLYDVHVYPKNKLNQTVPEKTVSEPTAPVLGSNIMWTITAPVPALAAGGTYTQFVITDTLDPRLTVTAAPPANPVVKINGVPVAATNYDVTGNVVVTFNAGGLTELNKPGEKTVTVDLTTTVTSLGNGLITNQAIVNVNGSQKSTNVPQSNWGPLKVSKTAAQMPNHTLAGAEFTLHDSNGGPVIATYTTNASGEIVVDGLWVGNGATLSKKYWLHETKAPAGYVLPTGNAAWFEVTVNAGNAASAVTVTIQNTQQQGPNLPLTGSAGTTMFMLGGIALLLTAGGVGLVASSRRRQSTFK